MDLFSLSSGRLQDGQGWTLTSFRSYKTHPLHTSEALVLAVIQALTRVWPTSMDFDTLVEQTRADLPAEQGQDDETVSKAVLGALQTLLRLNSLRFTLEPSPYETQYTSESNDTPVLIPGFAHIVIQRTDPAFGVGTYNLWHDTINLRLKEAETWLLPHINGKNSRKPVDYAAARCLERGQSSGD